MAPPVVVADADVLFGATTRALLIFLDYDGVLKLHWSAEILREMSAALLRRGRQKSPAAARANERRMNASLPGALLDPARLAGRLPTAAPFVADPDDAHVLACALELLEGGYYQGLTTVVLTTRNLGDFHVSPLQDRGVQVMHPDALLAALPVADLARSFRSLRLDLARETDAQALLERLAKDGQVLTAAALCKAGQAGAVAL